MAKAVIQFHPKAAAEYRAALSWYRGRSRWVADKFRDEMKPVIHEIATDSDQGTVFRGPYHWMRLRRYPYLDFYKSLSARMVRIQAVAHGRRRFGYWLRRK
jgi:hypothetical protein